MYGAHINVWSPALKKKGDNLHVKILVPSSLKYEPNLNGTNGALFKVFVCISSFLYHVKKSH